MDLQFNAENFDFYGTYTDTYYAESMKAFCYDYWCEVLEDALSSNDSVRVSRVVKHIKKITS